MRRTIGLLVLLLSASLPGWAQEPGIRISEIYADPDGDREFIELWNPGSVPVDLAGWSISDAAGNQFVFESWTLGPDDRVVVWGGGESNSLGPAWTKSTVWNNAGDTATLTSDGIVDEVYYPAATKGESWAWDGGWVEGPPTPGAAPGETIQTMQAEVRNVAPTATISGLPDRVAPGQTLQLVIHITDDNGPEDVVNWTLQSGNQLLAANTTLDATVVVNAPEAGIWNLVLRAYDQAGAEGVTEVQADVQAPALRVTTSEGGISFPLMAPGERNVTAIGTIRIDNLGLDSVTPRIDVSAFRGPVDWAVENRLEIGVNGAWISYGGPLTELPVLAGEAGYDVSLRVHAPKPLPAGNYGTSFTVIA